MEKTYFQLSNGVKIPPICLGTNITLPVISGNEGSKAFFEAVYRYAAEIFRPQKQNDWGKRATLKASRTLTSICREAFERGITAFDCSRAYGGSERRLSIALKNYPREDAFIITKIDDQSQFLGRVEECFASSLKHLRTDYADLLLLHWPIDYPPFPDERHRDKNIPVYARSWKSLEKIYKNGGARAIGVSNFTIRHLEELKKYAEIMPMADEFECHPLCIRKQLNDYCRQNGIQVLAYAALCGMDKRLSTGKIAEIANKYNKSVGQVILKWHIQNGRVPIFGTTQKNRLADYTNIFDFELLEEELKIVENYNANYRAFPDSEQCDFTKGIWIGWEKYKDSCP